MKLGNNSSAMMTRLSFVVIGLALICLMIGNVMAITASIGNARMILRANVGDTIEKSILVKNVNNETINIEVFASGDLEKNIKILDNNFTIDAGQEKNARFTIKVSKTGTTESQVNVKFFSPTEKKGVGLTSTVIVIASGEGTDPSDPTDPTDPSDPSDPSDPAALGNLSPLMILFIVTGIVLLIFLGVLIAYYMKNGKQVEFKNELEAEDKEASSNSKEKKKGGKGEKKETKQKRKLKRNE